MTGNARRRARATGALLGVACLVAASTSAAPTGYLAPPPQSPRVVSLVPAATEMLYALDAGDLVVGVSSWDRWPPEVASLPKVGALIDPDVERIFALRPDLVVVDPAQQGLIAQLTAAGIDSYAYATGSLEAVIEHGTTLGAAIGRPEHGTRFAGELRARLQAVAARVEGLPRPTVLLVFGRRPGAFSELWVNGGEGFLADLVRLAGGEGLFDDLDRPSFRASLEALLARPPEIVIEADGDTSPATLEREWRGLPGFDGVRVLRLDPAVALVPGPRVVETAELLARTLHPGR